MVKITILVLLLVLQLTVILSAQCTKKRCYDYRLVVQTQNKDHAGTDGKISARIIDRKEKVVNFGILDDELKNDFQNGALDIFDAHSSENVKVQCVVLSTDSGDAWAPEFVEVSGSNSNIRSYFYNTESEWLSTDSSEGVTELKMCEQGKTTYYITTLTSDVDHSGTDRIRATIKIIGSKGNTTTGLLDNRNRNDFEIAREDTFVFRSLKDVGKIKCIEVYVKGDDAWKFESIRVNGSGKKNKPAVFRNAREQWLSSDATEGVDSLRVCL